MNDEADFILAILARPEDESLRLIYADWLEERGDPRGEFLRRESQLTAVRREIAEVNRERHLQDLFADSTPFWKRLIALQESEKALHRQLTELRSPLPLKWLTWIDRTGIENCNQNTDWSFRCPRRWDQSSLTDDARIRYCSECDKTVHFSRSLDEARGLAETGRCVAVPSIIPRTPRDLGLFEMDIGLLDFEAIRKLAAHPREPLKERRLPLPLVEMVRRDASKFSI